MTPYHAMLGFAVRWASAIGAVCWLAGFMPAQAYAQTGQISGTVREAAGAPLPGVNVVVDGTGRGAATDADGRFVIDRLEAGSYTLVASAIGFRQARQEVAVSEGAATTVEIVLVEETLETGEVVVTAARREQQFADVPVSISVVQARELDARSIVSLDDALRYVPGVQMADNQVNIRGSSGFSFNTGSRVLLLLDGMPLLSPDRESIPFDALPLAQVERIEVVKGPGSALYGGGALGGVINVITRDFPETPETRLRAFGGVYDPVRYAVWRAAWEEAGTPRPFGGFSLTHARQFGATLGAWLNVAYRTDTGYLNYGAERDLDVFGKVGWRPASSLRVTLLGGWTQRTSDSFLYWNGAGDVLNPGRLSLGSVDATGTNDNRINLVTLLPSVTHVVKPSVFYTVKARLIGVVIQPLEDAGTPKPASEGTVGLRYGGELQGNWSPGTGRYLTIGMTGDALATESSFFQPDSLPNMVRGQPEGAAFVQWEQQVGGRLEVVAGVRYDAYKIDEGATETRLSPKLNLSFPLAEGLGARLAYGQGFRVPSLGERFVDNQSFFPLNKNLDLRPELSTSYEAGLRSRTPLATLGTAQFDIAAFWTTYERLVEPKFVPEAQAFQFVNLTKARIRGVEASALAATLDDRWRLSLGYTLLDADDLTEGQPLAFRSRHLFKGALSIPLPGPLVAGLDYRFSSRPERVDSDFSRFVRDARTTVPIHVLDARIGIHGRRFTATLLVNNALDYYYVERPAILAPPRHALLQLQLDL